METINDRIESLVNNQFKGNKAAFAKANGLPATGLSSYLGKQRRSKPSVDMIIKIIQLTGVDPWWLMTGEESTPSSSEDRTPEVTTYDTTEVSTSGALSPASKSGHITQNIGDAEAWKELAMDRKERIDELKKRLAKYE